MKQHRLILYLLTITLILLITGWGIAQEGKTHQDSLTTEHINTHQDSSDSVEAAPDSHKVEHVETPVDAHGTEHGEDPHPTTGHEEHGETHGGGHGGHGADLGNKLPFWMVLPFVAMLLSIAIIPLVAGHWWHKIYNQAIVSAIWGIPMFIYFLMVDYHQLVHTGLEYISFIVYVGALFTISGGIFIKGDLRGTPMVNTSFLAIGAVLANFIGTPGASMLLIRPVLRANKDRKHIHHIPLFFIFIVSNIGGCLTPLGDPPLFLGFLRGVPFFWTLNLFPQWLTAIGILLAIFFVWDNIAYGKENVPSETNDNKEKFGLMGTINFIPLLVVLAAVLLTGTFTRLYEGMGIEQAGMYGGLTRDVVILIATTTSYFITPKIAHQRNQFNFYPVKEVATLFAGIFTTMIPAMLILQAKGDMLGLSEPWHFFWTTGILSSVLDNAPTYLTFGSVAQSVLHVDSFVMLTATPEAEALLRAISLGAVFMGANSYIGNGPNFMVRAIVEHQGTSMPSFFGYMLWAALILFPVFIIITFIFLL